MQSPQNRGMSISKFYPLFFTVIFVVVVLQYSFSSLEAIFYDLRVKYDLGISYKNNIVLITLDEESDQFLGENYPYSYSTHNRFMNKLLADNPKNINYLISLQRPFNDDEKKEQGVFKSKLLSFTKKGGGFRFGTDMDAWGEQLPPDNLRELGWSLALQNLDNAIFARDDVCRRAILDISGDESLHLWTANKMREQEGLARLEVGNIFGSYYMTEAEATFSMFRYFSSTIDSNSSITTIPFHRIVVGNFPKAFFKDKTILVGTKYVSNSSDFTLTPFNKDELRSSKLNVHAQIINSLYHDQTVFKVPRWFSNMLAIIIGLFLSLVISRLQPAKGLYITILTLFGVIALAYGLFTFFGMWLYLTHLILTIFIVYYIWVPFRAIEEYQSRYKLQEESKLLKKVDNLKQNFISLMSHDLKTPVAKIAGIADNLMHQYDNSLEQRRSLKGIVDSTKELNNFITSILDLTKVESQNLTFKLVSKDVNAIIEEVTNNLVFEIRSKEMKLNMALGPLFPIKLDLELMKRVVSNLVENAIKYAGNGREISVKTWDDETWVYVEISDNGVGIAPKDLEHVFEKFYKVKNDASHSIKGSGLGLYLVKYFIELHEGEISVESEVGQGTRFLIKLKNR